VTHEIVMAGGKLLLGKQKRCDVCAKRLPKTPRRVWRTPDDAFPLGLACSFWCAMRLLKRHAPEEAPRHG
jgi:hypothetical protein